MPMIVIARVTVVTRWAIASQMPARGIQTMLPISEGAPASGRLTRVRPKG